MDSSSVGSGVLLVPPWMAQARAVAGGTWSVGRHGLVPDAGQSRHSLNNQDPSPTPGRSCERAALGGGRVGGGESAAVITRSPCHSTPVNGGQPRSLADIQMRSSRSPSDEIHRREPCSSASPNQSK